jgi:hypothetical protein
MWRTGAGILALALAAACATTRGQDTLVNFSWTSEDADAVSGTMTATLFSGQSFTGKFFQVTSDTRVDGLTPLWAGWAGHRERPYWGFDAGPEFVKHYAGRVLANLADAQGDHMRCSFRLVSPASGMDGGGLGRCEASAGEMVAASFPAA